MHKTILVICYWRYRQKKINWSAHAKFFNRCLLLHFKLSEPCTWQKCYVFDGPLLIFGHIKKQVFADFAWGQTWGLFFIAHIESAERRFQLIWKIWNRLRTFREKRDSYWISEFGVLLVSPRVCVNIRGCAMQRTCTFFKHDAQEVFFINIITKLG